MSDVSRTFLEGMTPAEALASIEELKQRIENAYTVIEREEIRIDALERALTAGIGATGHQVCVECNAACPGEPLCKATQVMYAALKGQSDK